MVPSHSPALVVQLARLGDVIQSLPVIEALQHANPARAVDVLCASPLVSIARRCASVRSVLGWDGAQWRRLAQQWNAEPSLVLRSAQEQLVPDGVSAYEVVYNLNQHARSRLAAHLYGRRVVGAGVGGPLDASLSPWGDYLRSVAKDRNRNRVHLADAWCGMCGVKPLGRTPRLTVSTEPLPRDLESVGRRDGLWVALAVGAGDRERCVSAGEWAGWAQAYLERLPHGHLLLVGSGTERDVGRAIVEALPPLFQGRVWDATGRTGLPQLMQLLSRCRWVIGADTGPLHLGTAVGAKALGFYFMRARVHETGPYGDGHWVYQHETVEPPDFWPWDASIELLAGRVAPPERGWTLWHSRMDQWGVSYAHDEASEQASLMRESIWRALSPWVEEKIAV